jgi:hypothetical protein
MVDLALMAKLVAAVPNEARLILLGDRDQLASVEAGNVLADICAAAEAAKPNEPLHGAVVALQKNYRFAESGGIYRVSTAINAGDARRRSRPCGKMTRAKCNGRRFPSLPNSPAPCAIGSSPVIAPRSKRAIHEKRSNNSSDSGFFARSVTAPSGWKT